MNNFNSYFGQSGRYPMPGQLPQTSMPNRPDHQTPFSPSQPSHSPTTAKTANGLSCAPARPTSFMNQAASQPNDNRPSLQQELIPVEYREVTQWRAATIRATPEQLRAFEFFPDVLLNDGFTEIPYAGGLLPAGSLPDQDIQVHTVISSTRNRQTQPVPAQRHSLPVESDSGRPSYPTQYYQSYHYPHRNRPKGL